VEGFARQYCSSFEDEILKKLQFINSVLSLDLNSSTYDPQCIDLLKQQPLTWYDPLITQDIVTPSDLCTSLHQLYTELNKKGISTLDKVAVYTYSLLFHINHNALEEIIFERCVDSMMLQDPLSYCRNSVVTKSLDFTMWNDDTKIKACEEGGEQMLAKCKEGGTQACNPCAYTVAYMFAKYEKQVDNVLENLFKEIS